jgi:ABC-2 type transport system ATP-binding protein
MNKDSNTPIFQARGLCKRFGKNQVLNDLNLELVPGEVTVLLGKNGAGKSTLMRLALGILKAEAGQLTVCGLDPIRRPKPMRRLVGYVPDKPDCYDWMTAPELLRFLAPQYPTWDRDYADGLLTSLDVPRNTPFKSMSRGEGMKAMLVAALAPKPPFLMLDEPFAGLDPIAREDILTSVIGEIRQGERTVFCSTHDLDIASRIADRIAILAHGRIEKHGSVAEVLASEEPANVPQEMHRALRQATQGKQEAPSC